TLDPLDRIHRSSEEIEKYFADVKRSHPEIEEIFVFSSSGDLQKNVYIYSDKFVKAAQPGSDILSLFDRARMAQSFVDGDRKYLFIRSMGAGGCLFYPLRDQSGFAGVLLNKDFVSNDLIAGSISKVSGIYHGNSAVSSALAITITDENSQVLYSNATAQT